MPPQSAKAHLERYDCRLQHKVRTLFDYDFAAVQSVDMIYQLLNCIEIPVLLRLYHVMPSLILLGLNMCSTSVFLIMPLSSLHFCGDFNVLLMVSNRVSTRASNNVRPGTCVCVYVCVWVCVCVSVCARTHSLH